MNGIREEHIVEGAKYSSLTAIGQAYKERGVTQSAINKRYQRGMRNDDLIHEKKRKSYIKPVKESKDHFIVRGIAYKNAADACRKLDIKYGTYRSRKKRGFSDEEALEIVARLDRRKSKAKTYEYNERKITVQEMNEISGVSISTLLDRLNRKPLDAKSGTRISAEQAMGYKKIDWELYESQSEHNKNRQRRKAKRRKIVKADKSLGKEVWVKNQRFPSIAAAARFHGKDPEAVRAKLDKNLSIEQALGLESYLTSRSIVYKGQIYPNKKALAIQIGLRPFQVYEIPKERNFEQAIDELLCKPVIRGRRNETFYRNNPELGSSKGLIYFSEFNHPSIKPAKDNFFFKVGITQNLKTRNAGLKYIGKSWFQETTQLDASRAEAEIIDIYNDKLTDKISSKEVDGKGEIFEITKDQAVEFRISICKYLLFLDQPEKVGQTLSKGNLDN